MFAHCFLPSVDVGGSQVEKEGYSKKFACKVSCVNAYHRVPKFLSFGLLWSVDVGCSQVEKAGCSQKLACNHVYCGWTLDREVQLQEEQEGMWEVCTLYL